MCTRRHRGGSVGRRSGSGRRPHGHGRGPSGRQPVPALRPARFDDGAPGPGAHPMAEAVPLGAPPVVRLVRALHGALSSSTGGRPRRGGDRDCCESWTANVRRGAPEVPGAPSGQPGYRPPPSTARRATASGPADVARVESTESERMALLLACGRVLASLTHAVAILTHGPKDLAVVHRVWTCLWTARSNRSRNSR